MLSPVTNPPKPSKNIAGITITYDRDNKGLFVRAHGFKGNELPEIRQIFRKLVELINSNEFENKILMDLFRQSVERNKSNGIKN